ncbi:MAG: hypothetical protein Q4E46_02860 [Candidatus Saccharibacteria bacterium]|nr:hypothetical protein [Candidatus Saccharibacteria bacterium]
MGQTSNKHYRVGESSDGDFLSPAIGTFTSPIKFLPYMVGIFGLAFLASCITASIMTPVQNSDAIQQVALTFDNSGYYANVSSSGLVNLDLIGTIDGATALAHDTVTTTTNSTTGYKLYISSDSSVAGANSLNGSGTSSGYALSPSTGTTDNPVHLATNTWGYTTATVSGNNNTVTESSNFIGMPLLHNENLLHSYNQAAESGSSIEVYYGVKANTALPAGTYTSNVVYTVIAEGNPAAEGKVALDKTTTTNLAGGETLTISTGLYTSMDNIGTGAQAPTITIGGDACTNVTPVITNSGAINFTCKTPAKSVVGYNDVTVSLPKFEKTYTLEDGLLYYVPWEDMEYMQDMTSYACKEVTTPKAYDQGVLVTSVPTTSLIDIRDGQSYTVVKLADGNCWMAQELAITKESLYNYTVTTDFNYERPDNANGTISANDSDINADIPQNFTGLPDSQTEDGVLWEQPPTQSHVYYDSDPNYGVYYNYFAATIADPKSAGEVSSTICPRGWTLPSNGTSTLIDSDSIHQLASKDNAITTGFTSGNTDTYSYLNLIRAYGFATKSIQESSSDMVASSRALRSTPFNYYFRGYYVPIDKKIANRDNWGHNWTSTVSSVHQAYFFGISHEIVNTWRLFERARGFNVRCLAR